MNAADLIIAPRLRAPRGGLLVGDRQYRGGVFLPESARPVLVAEARKAYRAARVEPTVIGIAGFAYAVEPIAIAPGVGTVAYSLQDLDRNRLHHVHRSTAGEVVCDCGDFTYRRCGMGQPCKHGRRLVELGLMPATTPTTLPPFARRGAHSSGTLAPSRDAPFQCTPRRPRSEPSAEDRRLAAQMFGGGQ